MQIDLQLGRKMCKWIRHIEEMQHPRARERLGGERFIDSRVDEKFKNSTSITMSNI